MDKYREHLRKKEWIDVPREDYQPYQRSRSPAPKKGPKEEKPQPPSKAKPSVLPSPPKADAKTQPPPPPPKAKAKADAMVDEKGKRRTSDREISEGIERGLPKAKAEIPDTPLREHEITGRSLPPPEVANLTIMRDAMEEIYIYIYRYS